MSKDSYEKSKSGFEKNKKNTISMDKKKGYVVNLIRHFNGSIPYDVFDSSRNKKYIKIARPDTESDNEFNYVRYPLHMAVHLTQTGSAPEGCKLYEHDTCLSVTPQWSGNRSEQSNSLESHQDYPTEGEVRIACEYVKVKNARHVCDFLLSKYPDHNWKSDWREVVSSKMLPSLVKK